MEPDCHILVVDDDSQVRQLIARFLKESGYRVSGARDGREMREALAAAAIDLIILDLMLPGTSGLELCRELRARSSVPIIMLTAKGEDTDRIVGLELGADDYLPKPFNPRELLARIRAVLRRAAVSDHLVDGGHDVVLRAETHVPLPCRPLAMKRAFSNLIENAVKYGTRARVSVVRRPDELVVTIDDDGPGSRKVNSIVSSILSTGWSPAGAARPAAPAWG